MKTKTRQVKDGIVWQDNTGVYHQKQKVSKDIKDDVDSGLPTNKRKAKCGWCGGILQKGKGNVKWSKGRGNHRFFVHDQIRDKEGNLKCKIIQEIN